MYVCISIFFPKRKFKQDRSIDSLIERPRGHNCIHEWMQVLSNAQTHTRYNNHNTRLIHSNKLLPSSDQSAVEPSCFGKIQTRRDQCRFIIFSVTDNDSHYGECKDVHV